MAENEKIIFELLLDDAQAEKKLEENNSRLREARQERSKLNKEVKEGSISNEEYGRSVTKLNREIKDLSSENRVLEKTLQANENSLDGLRNKLSQLTAARNAADLGADEFEKLQVEIKKTSEEISALEQAGGDFRRNVGNYPEAGNVITGAFSNIGSSITAALGPAALIATLATGIAKLFEFSQALAKTRAEVNLLTGATGDQLDTLTAKIQATADTFDTDFNETLIAANNLAKGFGISVEEATDKIQKGFAAGGNVTGELLPTLTEYSTLLGEVGISADETIGIITQSVKDGVFSDKGVDAIKEASIRLREFTPATRDAIEGIGLSSTEIQRGLEEGTLSSFEAIQKISNRLKELPDQANETGTAIADIFGGAGEDAGLKYLRTIGDISGGLDELVDGAGEVASANLRIADANEELNLVFNQLLGGAGSGFKEVKAAALEFAVDALGAIIRGLEATINFFIDLQNESIVFRGAIEGLKLGFKNTFDFIANLVNNTIDLFSNFGAIIKAILTGDFDAIPDLIGKAFEDTKKNFTQFGEDVAENFSEAIENTLDPKEKIKPFSFTDGEKEEVVTSAKETGEAVAKAVQLTRLQQLEDQKAFIERQILATEEGSAERLSLAKKLAETERDIALEADELTKNQRLLIKAQTFEQLNELDLEFAEFQREKAAAQLEEELANIAEGEERKVLLARQALLTQEIDLQEFNDRMFEIREEAILSEIEQFEEGSLLRLEKEVELEQLRADQIEEIRQQEIETSNLIKETEEKNNAARFQSAKSLTDGLASFAKEGTAIGDSVAALSKGFAIGEIVLNLQRQLTANAAAGAKISAAGAPATVPAGISYTATQNGLAVAQAAIATAKVASSFDDGGLAFEGGYIPFSGGMIKGRSHATGGVKFDMGGGRIGEADGMKGEAYIVNTKNDPYLKSIASKINVAGGGRPFFRDGGAFKFNDGGVASRVIAADVLSEAENRQTILDVVELIPAPVVGIQDIISESSTQTSIEDKATI